MLLQKPGDLSCDSYLVQMPKVSEKLLRPYQHTPLPRSPGSLDKAALTFHQSSDSDCYNTNYFIMGERITFNVIYDRTPLCSQSSHMNHKCPSSIYLLHPSFHCEMTYSGWYDDGCVCVHIKLYDRASIHVIDIVSPWNKVYAKECVFSPGLYQVRTRYHGDSSWQWEAQSLFLSRILAPNCSTA